VRPKVVFSSDGLAVGVIDSFGQVRLFRAMEGSWRAATFEPAPEFASDLWFAAAERGAGDRWLITAAIGEEAPGSAGDPSVRLWDLASKEAIVREAPSGASEIERPSAVAVSPDRQWMAVVDVYGAVRLWRLRSGSATIAPETFRLPVGATVVQTLAFSDDSRRLALGGETKVSAFHEVRVWTLADDGPVDEPIVLPGHSSNVTALAFAPDSRRLLSGGADGAISIWALEGDHGTNRPIVLRGHEAAVRALEVTGDGLRAASSAADGTVRLWSLEITSQPPIMLWADHEATRLEIAAGDRYVVGSGAEGVQLWRLNVDDLVALANRIAGRELTDEERRQYSLDAAARIH
jgi:WD40 repeat protein